MSPKRDLSSLANAQTNRQKDGATAEIAKKIGGVLPQAGLLTNVRGADEIKDLEPYNAVVLDSAVYVGKWRKEAVKFLEAHMKELAERLVWLFSSVPTGEGDPVERLNSWRFPEASNPSPTTFRLETLLCSMAMWT